MTMENPNTAQRGARILKGAGALGQGGNRDGEGRVVPGEFGKLVVQSLGRSDSDQYAGGDIRLNLGSI